MLNRFKHIDKDGILIYFIFFFCFEPKLFVKYNILNYIFIFGAIVSFLIILSKTLRNSRFSKMFVMIVIYRLSFAIQTFTNDKGDITMWGYFSVVLMTLCLTFDYYKKKKPYMLLSQLTNVLLYLVTVNLIIAMIFPNGIIDNIYFIGIRTRATDAIFPLLAITLICDYLSGVKISLRSIISIAVSIFTVIKLWIATAIIGGLIICAFLLLKNNKLINKITNLYVIVFVGLLINYLIVYAGIIEKFSWFIEGFLHKSITLSARTIIWEKAKIIINGSPLFGYGMTDNGNFVWNGVLASTQYVVTNATRWRIIYYFNIHIYYLYV